MLCRGHLKYGSSEEQRDDAQARRVAVFIKSCCVQAGAAHAIRGSPFILHTLTSTRTSARGLPDQHKRLFRARLAAHLLGKDLRAGADTLLSQCVVAEIQFLQVGCRG